MQHILQNHVAKGKAMGDDATRMRNMETERVEKIEVKLSYLEEMVSQLNVVVVSQQKEMNDLNRQMEALRKKVREIQDGEGGDIPSRRPPHY